MKTHYFFSLATSLLVAALASCQQPSSQAPAEENSKACDLAALVEDIPTTNAFLMDAVNPDDITKIMNAGINAPSAMNQQGWHFTFVTDRSVLQKIQDAMSMPGGGPGRPGPGAPGAGPAGPGGPGAPASPSTAVASSPKAGLMDAPLVVIVSANTGSKFGSLDAGLATQNIAVEAQLLGYGSKIVASPSIAINGPKKEEFSQILGIPEGMEMVSAVLIGKTDTEKFDATTMATPRKGSQEIVTLLEAK